MLTLTKVSELRYWVNEKRKQGLEIGLVPTMGYLHEGHLSLVRAAKEENQCVVMSIFVNPLQFGPNEDYSSYPRDFERDQALAAQVGVDVIFAPEVGEIYPQYPLLTTVQVGKISEVLCGAWRPGHFTGVATVVMKLFNIVQPDRAYFGQKDYQQVQIIRRMTEDLNIPVIIRTVGIKREEDGLAMSSRNTYLSGEERRQALCLSRALGLCQEMYTAGERSIPHLLKAMREIINKESLAVIDYVEIRDTAYLETVEMIEGPVVVALAVKIGRTRLIDNLVLT